MTRCLPDAVVQCCLAAAIEINLTKKEARLSDSQPLLLLLALRMSLLGILVRGLRMLFRHVCLLLVLRVTLAVMFGG